jgi:two-component system OmpR family response regulator
MAEKAKVLVADDNPDILFLLRTNLDAAGFETVTATDGELALRAIEEQRPDILLLDLMMPVLDGWGVLERLEEQGSDLPIIVVSASDSAANIQRATELGATGYVTKPFNLRGLIDMIWGVLGRSPEGSERG